MTKNTEILIKKIKLKIIGIGGGGTKIISEIAPQLKRPEFFAIDSDSKSLNKTTKGILKVQLGKEVFKGLGSGMDTKLAKDVVKTEQEKIKKIVGNCDMCVFIACLGGGIGSGITPGLSQMAKRSGALTYGIFTLPFGFEGEKKSEIAKKAIFELRNTLDAITILENEKIFQIVEKSIPLKKAFSSINKILYKGLQGLLEMVFEPGVINIDFSDLKTILKGKGELTFITKIESIDEKENFIKSISNPLYPYNVSGARKVLFNIYGPPNISLETLDKIANKIFELVGSHSKIIFGVSYGPKKSTGINFLAVGCKNSIIFSPENFLKIQKKVVPKIKSKRSNIKKKENQKKNNKVKTQKDIESEKQDLKKTRKNALDLHKEIKELEEEIIKKEEVFETPAFLRKLHNG